MNDKINPNQIIKECLKRGDSKFVVPSPSYFSSDYVEAEMVLRDFQKAGISVVDESSGIVLTDPSPEPIKNLIRQIIIIVALYIEKKREHKKAKEYQSDGKYGGGVVVAAANTPEEAAELGNSQASHIWNLVFYAKDAVILDTIFTTLDKPTVYCVLRIRRMTMHPILRKLQEAKNRQKRFFLLNFHLLSYYERLDYARTLVDYFNSLRQDVPASFFRGLCEAKSMD